jgi:MFS family permease
VPGVLLDLTPLRAVPRFRTFFIANMFSGFGTMMTIVTVRYQAYKLGGDSTLMVSLLAVVSLLPMIGGALLGGALADAMDRRRVLQYTQLALVACGATLSINAALARPSLVILFVAAVASSFFTGIDSSARASFVPVLVGKEHIHGALALQIGAFSVSGIVGPVLAGFFVRDFAAWLYGFDAASFLAMFVVLLGMPAQPPTIPAARVGLGSVRDGFRYLRGERTIQSTFAADLGAMIFGAPDALFPAFADQVFGDVRVLGLLTAAPAVGAVLGGVFNGWTARVRRQGMAVIWCIVAWGLGVALFGLTRSLPIALFGLVVAGAADVISATFRSTIVQVTVPDEYRGRLSAVFISVVRGGPRLGEFESGVAARLGGLQFSAVSGGLACLVWIAGVAWRYPELRHYDAAAAAHPVPDR